MNSPRPRARHLAAALLTLAAATQLGCYRTVYVTETAPPPPPPAPATVVVETSADGTVVEDFYEPLGYYGVWVDVAPYGRVWQPATDMAGGDFRPYASDGYWAVNDDGNWVFVSRYHRQWGWATYHYGRWVYNDWYGWVWVPGTRWSPAWVEWRYGGGYVGWAPVGPPGVVIVENHYVFVEQTYIGSANVYTYRVPPERTHTAYVAAQPSMGSMGGQGAPYQKAGPPLPELRAAGVSVSTAQIKTPEVGHAKVQGRAAVQEGAERKATGKLITTPQMRGSAAAGASAGVDGRGAASPMPTPAPGPQPGGVSPQPGMASPSGGVPQLPSSSQAGETGRYPSSVPSPQPGATPPSSYPSGRATPDLPQPVPQPNPVSRPSPAVPTPTPAPTTRPTPPPTPPPAATARPTPPPPAATPKPVPKPTATARPKPPPPKPTKRR